VRARECIEPTTIFFPLKKITTKKKSKKPKNQKNALVGLLSRMRTTGGGSDAVVGLTGALSEAGFNKPSCTCVPVYARLPLI